jgi:hypothetical protein
MRSPQRAAYRAKRVEYDVQGGAIAAEYDTIPVSKTVIGSCSQGRTQIGSEATDHQMYIYKNTCRCFLFD